MPVTDALVNINGVITRPEDAKVSVFDRGFLFGDGVYETGRSFDGVFLYLDEHFIRLRRSAGKLRIPIPWDDQELKRRIHETARAFGHPNIYYRLVVTRGLISRVGLEADAESEPTAIIIVQGLPANLSEKYKNGVSLVTSNIIRNAAAALDPNIKTSNYLNSLLALQDARARGGEDAVLCDSHGRVTEGTTFAIFAVRADGALLTPALEIGILDSITRRHVIDLARHDRKVEEGFFDLPTFQGCPEVFIASSVRGIVPVRQWDGRKYPVPGPLTRDLAARLRDDIARYVATHEKF